MLITSGSTRTLATNVDLTTNENELRIEIVTRNKRPNRTKATIAIQSMSEIILCRYQDNSQSFDFVVVIFTSITFASRIALFIFIFLNLKKKRRRKENDFYQQTPNLKKQTNMFDSLSNKNTKRNETKRCTRATGCSAFETRLSHLTSPYCSFRCFELESKCFFLSSKWRTRVRYTNVLSSSRSTVRTLIRLITTSLKKIKKQKRKVKYRIRASSSDRSSFSSTISIRGVYDFFA